MVKYFNGVVLVAGRVLVVARGLVVGPHNRAQVRDDGMVQAVEAPTHRRGEDDGNHNRSNFDRTTTRRPNPNRVVDTRLLLVAALLLTIGQSTAARATHLGCCPI